MLIKCVACRGMRKVKSMGGMIQDCSRCKGVGYIEEVIMTESKRAGRPKKEKERDE